MCLNARSIINKKNELDIMVDEIKPHIIGITESWANNDITDAELGLEGYVMFRKDRMGKRGGGVLLYIKETIPAYEVQLHEDAHCNEAISSHLLTLKALPRQWVALETANLQSLRSRMLTSVSPFFLISLLIVSMYLNFGLPLGLTPSTSISNTVLVIWLSSLRLSIPA